MRTSSRPVALLVFDEVDALDVAGPAAVLSAAGRHWNWRPFRLHIVAKTRGPLATRSQLTLTATDDFESCPPTEYLIVPGGYGARPLLDRPEMIDWVRERATASELVLAIGYGALLLAKAGVLTNTSIAAPHDVTELFAEVDPSINTSSQAATLTAGKFLTARGSAGGIEAALDLVGRVLGKKQAASVADAIGWSVARETIEVLP